MTEIPERKLLKGERLAEIIDELRLDSRRTGGVVGMAALVGVAPATVYHWLAERNEPPAMLRSWLQMYGLLTPEQRVAFREMRGANPS